MRNIKSVISSMIIPPLFFLSCSQRLREETSRTPIQQESKAELKSPDGKWKPLFFKTINERARIANLEELESTTLMGGDFEVRMWVGFGLIPLEGIVIKRSGEQWSAIHIRSISPYLTRSEYHRILPPPKSGWDNFWKQLTDLGITTLPDDSQLEGKVIATDGESLVVELNISGEYRTYRYSNPQLQRWPEAKQMIEIAKFIFSEFGIERPSLSQE